MMNCEYIQDEGDTVDLVVWEEWVEWAKVQISEEDSLTQRSKMEAVGIVSEESP
jgi:hypothetical protein